MASRSAANDPDELDNLAGRQEYAELMLSFEAEVQGRWDPPALRSAVLASQRTRRLAFQALSSGRPTAWYYQPGLHPRHYVSGHADLTDLERLRRFPPPLD